MKVGDLYYVEWKDHCQLIGHAWYFKGDLDKLEPIVNMTIGWIYKIDKEYITMYSEKTKDNNTYGTPQTILRNCIVKKTKVPQKRIGEK